MKEISPPQGTPPLDSRPQRKKYRPCLLKMGKILHFSACRGEEYFTAPHNTSRRGGFSFTPAPPLPHRQDKTHPAWLHQRTRAKKFALHAQNGRKRCFWACWASFSTEMPLEGSSWENFVAPWDWRPGTSTDTPADAQLNHHWWRGGQSARTVTYQVRAQDALIETGA